MSEWDIIIPEEKIELKRVLGKGAYGTVYLGNCYGSTVAVKKHLNKKLGQDKLAELQKEIDIMRYLSRLISIIDTAKSFNPNRRLKCRNIVLLIGLCQEPDALSIIMEYVPGRYD